MQIFVRVIVLIILTGLIILSGCKNDFAPFAGPKPGISVFSILDNRLPFQYVRLQKTYQYEEQKAVGDNAKIFISENNGDYYSLRDTIMSNPNYKYFYLPNYSLKRGTLYRISAIVDSTITSWADTFVPANPLVNGSLSEEDYSVMIKFLNNSEDYFTFKLSIEYETIQDGKKSVNYSEVPTRLMLKTDYFVSDFTVWNYPKEAYSVLYQNIMKKGESNFCVRKNKKNTKESDIIYPGDNIIYTLLHLNEDIKPSQITVKKVLFVFYSIDPNVYEKYAKTGNEQYSMRLGEVFYWSNFNVEQGDPAGFFGYVVADTLQFKIPSNVISTIGYNNGQ